MASAVSVLREAKAWAMVGLSAVLEGLVTAETGVATGRVTAGMMEGLAEAEAALDLLTAAVGCMGAAKVAMSAAPAMEPRVKVAA